MGVKPISDGGIGLGRGMAEIGIRRFPPYVLSGSPQEISVPFRVCLQAIRATARAVRQSSE